MRRAALLLALLTAACARPHPGDPPEIAIGRQECARCGMIISEERFSGGWIDPEGATVAFDDVGELLAAVEASPQLREGAWVRDFETSSWLRLADAHLARAEGFATPMGTGWAAFSKRSEADAFAAKRSR